jgi:hypothetical protein
MASTPQDLSLPGLPTLTPGQQATTKSDVSSGRTFFDNRPLVQAISGSLGGVAQDAGGQYMNFLQNPTGSPLFTNALSGLLGALQPSENNARRNLLDMFRAQGMSNSSTGAHGAMGLESELMRNRQALASNLLTTLFPQMAQALFAPMAQTPNLINALKLQEQSAVGSATGGQVASAGGGSGGGGGGGQGVWTSTQQGLAPSYTGPRPVQQYGVGMPAWDWNK